MGIILEKSKLIFDELVGTSSFDDVLRIVFAITIHMGLNHTIKI